MQYIKKILRRIYRLFLKKTKTEQLMWTENINAWNTQNTYDADNIIKKVYQATKNVKDGIFPYERDSVNFNEPIYQDSFIITLKKAIKKFGKNITILDFGGALGSHYYCYSKYPEFSDINFTWVIIEQEKFIEIGKKEFEDKNLKFCKDFKEMITSYNKPNVIIASSVFMYIENYNTFLEELIKLKSEFFLVARTFIDPTLNKNTTTTQNIPEGIYKAEYPCYIFCEDFYKPIIESDYQKTLDILSAIDGEVQKYKDKENKIKEFQVRDLLFECKKI